MAVDNDLTKRFYKALGMQQSITERKMMGGLCFMLNGNMIGGADRDPETGYGRIMFRIGKDNEAEALTVPGTSIVEQGGRRMGGMVFVDADNCTDKDLSLLAVLALNFVNTLPVK